MQETNSIIKAGVILAGYEFLMILMYFLLSTPIPTFINAVMDTEIVDELATYGSLGLNIFNLMFAIAFILPIVWFLLWCVREESTYYYRRYP